MKYLTFRKFMTQAQSKMDEEKLHWHIKHLNLILLGLIIFLTIVGFFFKLHTNKCSPKYEYVYSIDNNGKPQMEQYLKYETDYYLFSIGGDICFNLAFALFISIIVIRTYEQSDRKKHENKLKEERKEFHDKSITFQKAIAKEAIQATFETLIDKKIYEILEKDVFSAEVLRKDAMWRYKFYHENGKLRLERCITYRLENISNLPHAESLPIQMLENEYSKTISTTLSIKKKNDKKYTNCIEIEKIVGGLTERLFQETIQVREYADFSLVIIQEFVTDFVYETHFTRYPLIGLTISVEFPNDYKFDISLATLSSIPEEIPQGTNNILYKTEGAIYRGQGIEFFLGKKNSPEENPINTKTEHKIINE